tara:strand:- start:776 stop:1498 length:723 start_codon:yes stop_codon:yes gene_type:complete
MSKQVKLKFKKLIKQAEFVHADLEYHEELSIDAKNLFRDAIQDEIQSLSAEETEKLNHCISEREAQQQELLRERQGKQDVTEEPAGTEDPEKALKEHPDIEKLPDEEEWTIESTPEKTSEIKKLFHKIAAQTHPDKSTAKGFPAEESQRREKIFKNAKSAYEEENWYTLYAVATELGIEVENISEQHIEWVEEGIRATLAKIAHIGNLVAWGWYTGDDSAKAFALRTYFFQIYGYEWTPS